MSLGLVIELLLAFLLVMVLVHKFLYVVPWYLPALVIVFTAALIFVLWIRRLK